MTETVLSLVAGTGTSLSTAGVTLSGSDRHLVVFVASVGAPSSVTFGGSAMSFLREDTISGSVLRSYELDDPPTTSDAVATASFSGSQSFICIGGIAYTDIDSVRNSTGTTGSTQSVSFNATTEADDIVISAGFCFHTQDNPCADTTTYTVNHGPNAGQTEKTQYNAQSTDGAASAGSGISISYELATGTSTSSGQNLAVTIDGSCLDPAGYSHLAQAVVLIPATGGGGTEVALTGIEITSAQGSLGKAFSKELTGIEITSAQGSLSPGQSQALTGIEITSAQGTLVPSLSIALTGIESNLSQGTLSPSTGTTVELTGIEITSAQGSLGVTASVALTGIEITSAQGTLTPQLGGSSLSNPSATSITYNGWTATVDYTP